MPKCLWIWDFSIFSENESAKILWKKSKKKKQRHDQNMKSLGIKSDPMKRTSSLRKGHDRAITLLGIWWWKTWTNIRCSSILLLVALQGSCSQGSPERSTVSSKKIPERQNSEKDKFCFIRNYREEKSCDYEYVCERIWLI